MDPSRLLRRPVVVEVVAHTGARDAMGDPTEEVSWQLFRGWLWQTGASEATGNQEVASESWQLALDKRAAGVLAASSRVYVDGALDDDGDLVPGSGEAFEVIGPPWQAQHPVSLQVVYVQARVERSA